MVKLRVLRKAAPMQHAEKPPARACHCALSLCTVQHNEASSAHPNPILSESTIIYTQRRLCQLYDHLHENIYRSVLLDAIQVGAFAYVRAGSSLQALYHFAVYAMYKSAKHVEFQYLCLALAMSSLCIHESLLPFVQVPIRRSRMHFGRSCC